MKIEASDAYEDAELKYDFKVTFPQYRRGVAVADPPKTSREAYVEEKKRLGIQFTTNMLPEVLKHKSQQIRYAKGQMRVGHGAEYVARPVDDIVLVAVSMDTCTKAFLKWEDSGRPPGGPEQFLKMEDRIVLVQAMLRNRVELPESELQELLTRKKTEVK